MRYRSAVLTSVTSTKKPYQNIIVIFESIAVLSILVLLLGATTVMSQTNQNLCAGLTGQPYAICTSATVARCVGEAADLDPRCGALVDVLNNHCSECIGRPIWTINCPCSFTLEDWDALGYANNEVCLLTNFLGFGSAEIRGPGIAHAIFRVAYAPFLYCFSASQDYGEFINLEEDEAGACVDAIINVAEIRMIPDC